MGKTLGDGFAAKGALRHKEPLVCAQGALGRWLVTRFTLEQEEFPSPTSEEWREIMLWPHKDPTKPMTYQTHKARLAALYAKLDIYIEKVTHACRIWAARWAEEAGLSDVVSGCTTTVQYTASQSPQAQAGMCARPAPARLAWGSAVSGQQGCSQSASHKLNEAHLFCWCCCCCFYCCPCCLHCLAMPPPLL